MSEYLLTLACVLFVYMNVWFVVGLIKKRNDVADVAWGLGFVLMAWTSFALGMASTLGLVLCSLVTVWGLRLAWHIHKRNARKPEDRRYAAWRQQWGTWVNIRAYAQVYILQGALLFAIVLPVLLVNYSGAEFGVLAFVGVAVWILGFLFESVGDAQLAKFLANPENRGKLMTTGLWAYTRHPNYFGEVTLWWGVWVASLGAASGLVGIVGPLVITMLILKVSGVPMLERSMREHPDFAEYARRVSVFIPWPPKRA